MSGENSTGKTKDIDSIVNSAVMAVDAIMRKNEVPFGNSHAQLRALLMPIIASAVADDRADLARVELNRVLEAVG